MLLRVSKNVFLGIIFFKCFVVLRLILKFFRLWLLILMILVLSLMVMVIFLVFCIFINGFMLSESEYLYRCLRRLVFNILIMRSIVLVFVSWVFKIWYFLKMNFFWRIVGWLGMLLSIWCIVWRFLMLFLNYFGLVRMEMILVLVRVYLWVWVGVLILRVKMFLDGDFFLIFVVKVILNGD